MDDTANNRELVLAVGRLLTDHKAAGTVVLDVGAAASWADYLVIATARSTVHAMGLIREVDAFLSVRGIRPVNPHKKLRENGWQLLDCGTFVVHVMLQEQRDFYALEKLWFKGIVLDPSEGSPLGGTRPFPLDGSPTTRQGQWEPRAEPRQGPARKGHATAASSVVGVETASREGVSGTAAAAASGTAAAAASGTAAAAASGTAAAAASGAAAAAASGIREGHSSKSS